MEQTDEELIEAHLSGDERAFPMLLERYLKQIYNFAFRLVGDSEDAEDISQETFLKAWKNLPKYRRQSSQFRTWLFHIARNTAIDSMRKRKNVAFSQFEDAEGGNVLTDTLTDEEPLPDELFAQTEGQEAMNELLLTLPPPSREVLLLRYMQDLTFDEIGKILDEPLNTVKSRHRRALILLRKTLERAHPKEAEQRIL